MSDEVGLSLTVVLEIAMFSLLNFYAFKLSREDVKGRIWAEVLLLLLTPLMFFGTLFFVLLYDESGWGAGILTVIFMSLYIVNGIIILLTSIYLHFKQQP